MDVLEKVAVVMLVLVQMELLVAVVLVVEFAEVGFLVQMEQQFPVQKELVLVELFDFGKQEMLIVVQE